MGNNQDELKLFISQGYDLNFEYEYKPADLDEYITPLAAASFFGKVDIANMMLNTKFIDVNMATKSTGTTFGLIF